MALYTKTSHGTATFQAESNTAYHIILKGAGGGGAMDSPGKGGQGHKIEGVFVNSANSTLHIYVGQGGMYKDDRGQVKAFNGGGANSGYGGGGGGATDIRIGGTALSNRIFVAGGGGGGADKATGANGGYPKGSDGTYGKGGTQTSGGTGYKSGTLGVGGDAYWHNTSSDSGAGGGGYYGGGSGRSDSQSGGGGSSYFNSSYIKYPTYPNNGGGGSGGNEKGNGANGSIEITKIIARKPTTRLGNRGNIYYSFNVEPGDTNRTKYHKTLKVSCADVSSPYTLFSTQEDITTEQTFLFANLPEEFKNKEITFTVDNGYFTTTTTTTVDAKPPTITFPQETYSKPWEINSDIQNAYEGTDTSDKSLDYEVEQYVDNRKVGNTLKTKDTTFNTGNFVPYTSNPTTYLKVRALQSADTENGTGTDIWSDWYTSPTTTYNIPEIITFKPDFLDKIFLQGETKACGELFSCVDPNVQSLEVTHIINEVEDSTSTIEVSQGVEGATITPPLKYHIYNPKDWQYTYQLKIRAKNSIGQYSKYYLSPKTKAEYNIAPKDPTFTSKAFKDIYVVNEKFRVEWSKVTDPNGTDVTYDLALLDSEGTSLATWTKITDNFKEVVIPNVSPQTGCYFTLMAFSDRLYSSKVSSKPFAITDVNITDCNLTFPNLTTNLVIEKVNEIAIVINGDTRLIKTTNLSNYVLPLHYFRSGKNTLTLKVKDKINTVIERTWNVNLTLDKANLVSGEQPTVTGYFAFNYDNTEHFNKAVELQKSNVDLGVVEHTFLGSTPFEGSNTVTQKLEITRKANDDTTQLRTIKITGAIE